MTGILSAFLGSSRDQFSSKKRFIASDYDAFNTFGNAVSISSDGTTLAIGASGYANSSDAGAGSVYIYLRTGGSWALQQKISGESIGDQFGASLSLSDTGNTLVIGAPYRDTPTTNAGAVYIYTRSAGVWTQAYRAQSSTSSDLYGTSVSISGDGLIVCAVSFGSTAPRARTYSWNGSVLTFQSALLSSDHALNDSFGISTALSSDGSTLIVGASNEDPGGVADAGSAYVFTRSGTTWTEQQKISASDAGSNDFFGTSVAIGNSGDFVVVGAPATTLDAGAAYTFTRAAGVWTQQQKLSGATGAQFACAVSCDSAAEVVAVGSKYTSSNRGAVMVFVKVAGVWTQRYTLTALTGFSQSGDLLGSSVSVSSDGTYIAAGSPPSDDVSPDNDPGSSLALDAGSVHVFT